MAFFILKMCIPLIWKSLFIDESCTWPAVPGDLWPEGRYHVLPWRRQMWYWPGKDCQKVVWLNDLFIIFSTVLVINITTIMTFYNFMYLVELGNSQAPGYAAQVFPNGVRVYQVLSIIAGTISSTPFDCFLMHFVISAFAIVLAFVIISYI